MNDPLNLVHTLILRLVQLPYADCLAHRLVSRKSHTLVHQYQRSMEVPRGCGHITRYYNAGKWSQNTTRVKLPNVCASCYAKSPSFFVLPWHHVDFNQSFTYARHMGISYMWFPYSSNGKVVYLRSEMQTFIDDNDPKHLTKKRRRRK